MKITKTKIKRAISTYLQEEGGGPGFSYGCTLNGEFLRYNSYPQLKKLAGVGDVVAVEMYAGGRYHVRTVRFTLTEDFIFKYGKEDSGNYWRPVRDFQKERVYNWQWSVCRPYRKSLHNHEITELIGRIVNDYDLKPHTWAVEKRLKSTSHYNNGHIRLAKGWGRDIVNIVHEMAHAVARKRPSHGSEYVGVVMEMFNKYIGVPMDDLIKSADRYKLKYEFTN